MVERRVNYESTNDVGVRCGGPESCREGGR